MAHTLSNIPSRNSAKSKLISAFRSCQVTEDIFPVYYDEFLVAIKEIRKSGVIWLSDDDITEIFFTTFLEFPGRETSFTGPFTDLFNEEKLGELADQILDKLVSPREYVFYIPLPNFSLESEIHLTSTIALVKGPAKYSGDFGHLSPDLSYLRVNGCGYVRDSRTQSAFIDAMEKVKHVIQISSLFNCIKKNSYFDQRARKAPFNLRRDMRVKWVGKIINQNDFESVELASNVSKFFSELIYSWPLKENQDDAFLRLISYKLEIIDDTRSSKNVISLRRALGWSFDAACDEDENMKFIKTCIGLEAALCEQNEEMGITEQLADRCAFLLAHTPTERMEKRRLMREIYKLRSKLVHGVAGGLSANERELARKAKGILEDVLRKEIKSLLEWHERTFPDTNKVN